MHFSTGWFNRRDGTLRYDSHEALCAAFRLAPGTPVVLTGTDQDPPLERWWVMGSRRREIVRGLRAMGVALTTTPNFSLFVYVARHVDLHAIKRIALVHWELLDEGLPAALHVNGPSETDFRRWGKGAGLMLYSHGVLWSGCLKPETDRVAIPSGR